MPENLLATTIPMPGQPGYFLKPLGFGELIELQSRFEARHLATAMAAAASVSDPRLRDELMMSAQQYIAIQPYSVKSYAYNRQYLDQRSIPLLLTMCLVDGNGNPPAGYGSEAKCALLVTDQFRDEIARALARCGGYSYLEKKVEQPIPPTQASASTSEPSSVVSAPSATADPGTA
jgi:hypothetical protein